MERRTQAAARPRPVTQRTQHENWSVAMAIVEVIYGWLRNTTIPRIWFIFPIKATTHSIVAPF